MIGDDYYGGDALVFAGYVIREVRSHDLYL